MGRADPLLVNVDNSTPPMAAAGLFLADKGARIEIWNRKNKHGWTPLAIATGYRFGNFKPSPPTVAVLQRVMTAAGVSTDLGQVAGRSIY